MFAKITETNYSCEKFAAEQTVTPFIKFNQPPADPISWER